MRRKALPHPKSMTVATAMKNGRGEDHPAILNDNQEMKCLLLLVVAACANAQPADPWKGLQMLSGEWVGEGAGSPGASEGACSFTFDLQRKVMVRKSYAAGAAIRHEDLMVVYLEKGLKAIYFDNEDHVIHYTVEAGARFGAIRQ